MYFEVVEQVVYEVVVVRLVLFVQRLGDIINKINGY